jgi:transcriptional regulator with XRE-family HTH domain
MIALLMQSKGITQVSMAARLGIAPSHLNTYLKGHGDIHASLFLEILKQLDIDIEETVSEQLATSTGLQTRAKDPLGSSLELLIRSLPVSRRKALVGYLRRYFREALHASFQPQIEQLNSFSARPPHA